MTRDGDTLILAWGNPSRLDDGLGPAFAREMREAALPGVTVETDFQLHVEDAFEVSRYRRVIFVDADRSAPEPFRCERLYPEREGLSFSTHSVTPGATLTLARDLFKAEPEAWIIGIRGYEFGDFGECLTDKARSNLGRAVAFVREGLRADDLHEFFPTGTSDTARPAAAR